MKISVAAASSMFWKEPKSSAAGLPPPACWAATGSSVMPITVITVPVTTGGKSRSRRLKYGAAKNVTTPATITAP